jgi:hypothetical protein
MSSKKPVGFRGLPDRRVVLLPSVRTKKTSLPPLFLTMKLRRSIERLLPVEHHQRLRLYFDTYGCLRCLHKDVIYGGNGFCRLCLYMIGKRLKKLDRQLQARHSEPPPDLEEAYLRPYNSARKLLADLVPTMGKDSTGRKREPKSPPKVYMKWLT